MNIVLAEFIPQTEYINHLHPICDFFFFFFDLRNYLSFVQIFYLFHFKYTSYFKISVFCSLQF